MDLKNKTILVTGAGGFIGSQLVEALLAEGARVRAFVRLDAQGKPGLVDHLPESEQLEIIPGDLRTPLGLHAIFDAVKDCELVYHLWSLIPNRHPSREDTKVDCMNFMGALNVLMACRKAGISRLVHVSISDGHEEIRHIPLNEECFMPGEFQYADKRFGTDDLAQGFHRECDLPVVTVRPFSPFGPRQPMRAVIPSIIKKALAEKNIIRVDDFESTRDFTYVTDTVRGLILAGTVAGVEGITFDLGTGHEVQLADLARQIALKLGRNVEVVVEPKGTHPESTGDIHPLADVHPARKMLGWRPQVSLNEGLDKTIAWTLAHGFTSAEAA